jgi:hypothetical protein
LSAEHQGVYFVASDIEKVLHKMNMKLSRK